MTADEIRRNKENLVAKIAALENALQAHEALPWLEKYGPKGPQPKGDDGINVSVEPKYASGLSGAKVATHYLEAAIRLKFGMLNELAIELARADIQKAGCDDP